MSANSSTSTHALRLAYLNSEYPSLSHTFIEREIRAIRALGVSVDTFSIRRPDRQSSPGKTNEQAASETYYILCSPLRFVLSVLAGVCISPLGALRALAASQRLAPDGFTPRIKHLAYAGEGIRLARELERRQLTHVHVHMANNGAAVAMLACAFAPALRYSLSIHGSAEFFHVDTWRLAAKVEGAVFVRCISHFCRAQVMAWTRPATWSAFHVIHCGIDTSAFPARPPREPGPLRVLAVGRLHPIKGYQILLEAMELLVRAGHALELDLVGDGVEREDLEQTVRTRGLAKHVHFSGGIPQEHIAAHYARADVMVLTSFMEGVPTVLMEAMSTQVGVVATQVGGIPELMTDGMHGRLVPPGSAELLAAALAPMSRDPGIAGQFGSAGRQLVLDEFSIDKTAASLVALFQSYLLDQVSTQAARTTGVR